MLETEQETKPQEKGWEQTRALSVIAARRDRASIGRRLSRLINPVAYLRRRATKIGRLASHPLLRECSRADRKLFAWFSDEIECPPGETLVRQGWIGYWFFLIDQGAADVIQEGRAVGRLYRGQYFGELALFGGGAHPATIKALTRMRLFVIHRRHLAVLIDRIPLLRRELIASMVRRLRTASAVRGLTPAVLTPDLLADVAFPKPRWALVATRRIIVRIRRLALALVLIVPATIALANYHPPIAVLSPGPTFDISKDIVISGVPADRPNGRYLLTSVRVARPNVFGLLLAAIRADREIVPIPKDEDLKWIRDQQHALFNESRLLAAAAAARAEGLPVSLTGTGAVVTGLVPESPAVGVLERGDVILGIDNGTVGLAADAAKLAEAHKGRSPLKISINRDGRTQVVYAERADDRRNSETVLSFGAFVQTRDLQVQLPFQIQFRERDISGPSAGLVYALAISDMLNKNDFAGGRAIAATGTIDTEGRVGPVGGLRYKGEASHQAGAWIFLVPLSQVDETSGQPLLAFGITSLKEALAALFESQL